MRLEPSDWTYVKFFFGQYGEDAVFMSFWDWDKRKTGSYVDVGAFHPINLSNTHALYRQGWRGLTVDPNPQLPALFARHRPEGKHVCCAIGAENSEATYYSFKLGNYNTLDPEQLKNVPADLVPTATRVPVRTLKSILDENWSADRSIDLLNVDCEGFDTLVLQSNDWTRYKPAWILVEDEIPSEQSATHALLTGHGYQLIAFVRRTKLFRLEESVTTR